MKLTSEAFAKLCDEPAFPMDSFYGISRLELISSVILSGMVVGLEMQALPETRTDKIVDNAVQLAKKLIEKT